MGRDGRAEASLAGFFPEDLLVPKDG